MSEPFIGEIRMFGGSFAPRGWAFCDGQLMSIMENQTLFSVIGNTYGGDGRTNFGLPDLRGRIPMHPGTSPGLSHYNLGERGGQEQAPLQQTTVATGGGDTTTVSVGASPGLPNMQPYTCVNFIIALEGVYPSRN